MRGKEAAKNRKKYPLQGNKYQDYSNFREIVKLMEIKVHLTKEGLDQIRKINNGMI